MGILSNLFGRTNNKENLVSLVNEGAFLVDVRSPDEFAQGNVKGSVNIPLDQLQNQLSKFKGKENIVVFCRSGNRSGHAKSILEQSGFTNVVNGGSWNDVYEIVEK